MGIKTSKLHCTVSCLTAWSLPKLKRNYFFNCWQAEMVESTPSI